MWLTQRVHFLPLLMIIYAIIPIQARRPVSEYTAKAGTLEQVIRACGFAIRLEFRRNEVELQKLREALKEIAAPPKKLTVYEMKSDTLGTWLIIVDTLYRDDEMASKEFPKNFAYMMAGPKFLKTAPHVAGPEPYWESSQYEIHHHAVDLDTSVSNLRRRADEDPNKDPGDAPTVNPGDLSLENHIIAIPSSYPELVAISQPPGVNLDELEGNYYTYGSAGNGVIVYVIDTGCDTNHWDLSLQGFNDEDWLFPGPMPSDEKSDEDITSEGYTLDEVYEEHEGYHGTSVAGKLLGIATGVAPSAQLVVVKRQTGRNDATFLTVLDCLLKIYDHFLRKRNSGRRVRGGIINMSFEQEYYGIREPFNSIFYTAYVQLLVLFKGLGIYVVNGAGNTKGYIVDGTPAILKEDFQGQIENLIVVGGVDTITKDNIYQADDLGLNLVNIYAPANKLVCPVGGNKHIIREGTSFATALTSGLLATFIGAGIEDPSQTMLNFAIENSNDEGLPILWNGLRKQDWDNAVVSDPSGGSSSGDGDGSSNGDSN
ncbi:hypothetical protein TWF694_003254 [Orbilia ellipsospora]|uniref:Peptidase S8/S53 domain-containing protein n=1 Tax=Orbilia ellipsospora TaxID=2528407 RepID=A0AAV9X3J6_9PEZI